MAFQIPCLLSAKYENDSAPSWLVSFPFDFWMEQSEGFKTAVSKIKLLENQLLFCDKTMKECEQSGIKAEQEIEEHFAKCLNFLATRKETLLKEVAQKVITHSMSCLQPINSNPFALLILKFLILKYFYSRKGCGRVKGEVGDIP